VQIVVRDGKKRRNMEVVVVVVVVVEVNRDLLKIKAFFNHGSEFSHPSLKLPLAKRHDVGRQGMYY